MTRRRVPGIGDRAAALRAAVARRRPATRLGTLRAILAGFVVVAVLAVGLVALGLVVPVVYGEYGFHPEENARSWAALEPQYADATLCQRCHAPEYAPWQASAHSAVTCEACHGPLAQHATAGAAAGRAAEPAVEAGAVAIGEPVTGLCVLCHEQSSARPITFAQVDLERHFGGAPCLGCHDSHAATALSPPEISHALTSLPACVTCHKPAGLRPVPVGHEEVGDQVCRTCHKRPAGSE